MLSCVMCVTNAGHLESGKLSKDHWYTIDNIIVKMSDGRRLKRYAVCVDGKWKSNQRMTLREARETVESLKRDYSRPAFTPLTIAQMREIAKKNGAEQAYNLLLLGGYGFIEGTCKDYDDLLNEFKMGMEH